MTAIAVLNAQRLQLSTNVQRRMVLGGVLVMCSWSWRLPTAIIGFGLDPERGARARLLPRWSYALINLLWAAVLVRWQAPAARHYESFGRGEYASMWGPGFIAGLASTVLFAAPLLWFLWITGRLP